MDKLAIVVPCYNEEEVMAETISVLVSVIVDLIKKNKIADSSFVLFVDDGSKDKTWELIEEEYGINKYVCGLKLSRNRGHQNALLAGLEYAKNLADITVSIDADLQDDVAVIEEMVDKYHEGCEVVYGVRDNRETDSMFKRNLAQIFYKLMKNLGVESVYNHADYRLMSKKAIDELGHYQEQNLFLRGIIPLIGYKTDCVYYSRGKRTAGESKYPLKKMISFAWDGITSFSIKPITMISILGGVIAFFSGVSILYILIGKLLYGQTIQGWTSTMISIWFLGGVQLMSIGVIGEYIGKTYMESKRRPRYNIETTLSQSDEKAKYEKK
ncbi:MAG: glycosyltransferase [Firmicutes bacterium HGW-Firmicutes-17]|jgi:glycosyltransferase involved in cell wall biosynthesis|nr:MAG: glycosyltransferase [Firmicutes bacterium HGW-Firmicutes-17]